MVYTKNPAVINYQNLLQYIIKKGKKSSLEKEFFDGLIFWAKSSHEKNFTTVLQQSFTYTKPFVSVKTKRKGSKNIFLPQKISENRGQFLSAKWMLTNAFAKKKNKLYESIIEELIESSLKKSTSVKKRDDLHKLADESLVNIK